MKYLGEKSLSSVLSVLLKVIWYGIILLAIGSFVFFYFLPLDGSFVLKVADFFNWNLEDPDWIDFASYTFLMKSILLPYFGAIVIFALLIVKKSGSLFRNFKNDIVFSKKNVLIISSLSKLLIVFSIFTFNITSLVISILLLVLCDIFKNGTVLQDDQDLTI